MDDDVAGLGESTGLVVSFYELLWRKKNDKQEKSCKHPGFFVHLPDTIVYNFSQPQYWYFTSVQYRCVNKKKRTNMNSKNILEKFLRCRSRSGIVAGFMWNDDSVEGRARVRDGGAAISIRYFDSEGLRRDLLRLGQFSGNGVLQQFVEPKAGVDGTLHNSTLQVTWQPNHVRFEKRQNKHSLTDSRLNYQKRAETIEGTFENSESFPLVSPILLDEITSICEGIAEHFWYVAECVVKTMVLNFRIDENNKVWLLFCSQISVTERDPVARSIAESQVSMTGKTKAEASKKARTQDEVDKEAELQRLHGGSGPDDDAAHLQIQAMLDRLPRMTVERTFQHQSRQPKDKSFEVARSAPVPASKERKAAKVVPPACETFTDAGWGQSAVALKRIVFDSTLLLSASQR